MNIWIVEASEPLPEIDKNARKMRCTVLANYLVDGGHQVEWWTSNFSHITKKYRFPETTDVSINSRFHIHLLNSPKYKRNISFGRIIYNLSLAKTFSQKINESQSKPDLIFVCMPTLELAEKCVDYGKIHQIPVVVDTRDLWPDVYLTALPKYLHSVFKTILKTEFDRAQKIYQNATGIVAISKSYFKWSLDLAQRAENENDGIFPLGYSINLSKAKTPEFSNQKETIFKKFNLKEKDFIICFFGTFGKSYDLLTVVQAAHLLSKQGITNIKIIIAGDGDKKQSLINSVQKLNLNTIFLPGWIDKDEIQTIMEISSVGLVPYTKQALQSLPNKPFEYMSASLPVLSSLSGEFSQMVLEEEIGINYQAENPESLATALLWCFNNKDKCQEYGTKARLLVEKQFSNQSIYPKLVNHLESVYQRYQEAKNISK
jgi:glycosyltransferase involved in cell wall biosynthesis